MDRLVLLVIACAVQVGCQAPAPKFDPFAITGQTRVPAPPTGAVGRPNSYAPPAATPVAPLNSGLQWRPEDSISPAAQRQSTALTLAENIKLAAAYDSRPASEIANDPQRLEQRSDRLTWRDPESSQLTAVPIYEDPSVVSYPTHSFVSNVPLGSAQPDQPRPLPRLGPVQPLVRRNVEV